jgi:hypothetical protein
MTNWLANGTGIVPFVLGLIQHYLELRSDQDIVGAQCYYEVGSLQPQLKI